METKVIKFYMDEDSRPVKELMTLKSMKESLFKDQYFLALNQIESYLSALKRVSGKDDLDLDSVNNIFAFLFLLKKYLYIILNFFQKYS